MVSHWPLGFGELLKRYREATGLTQEALAERAHVSVDAISALERGVRRMPRRDTLQLLARALGLSEQERAALTTAARRSGTSSSARPPSTIVSHPMAQAARHSPMRPPFVGRTRELALVEHFLAPDEVGPPVLLVAGEPGIGKTRLLQEAATYAAGTG